EVWFSLYQVAQIEERMEYDWPEVMDSYLAAWQYQPDRAGPLYRIAMHYQGLGEYHIAHMFFTRALKIPRPAPSRLFVENTIYDYQLLLEYGVACYYVGDHAGAIEANNSLLRSGLVPPHAIDQVIRNRWFSLNFLFPKVESPSSPVSLQVLVPFRDPGPELDDCVHSLRNQHFESFQVVFLDCGSAADQSSRVPAPESRFSFVRAPGVGFLSAVANYVHDHVSPDEVVMVLPPQNQLAEIDSLKHVATMFEDPDCALAYGQFRSASGELGSAEPAPDERSFLAQASAFAGAAPVAFRARLLQQISNSPEHNWDELFRAAGYVRTRFSDTIWTILNECAGDRPAADPRPAAPALLQAKLPLISCLMVTLDRLTLAKRAIRSFAAQSYPERELVIVTDGTDTFRQSLERYIAALELDKVRFVTLGDERLTLGRLRNISMDAAEGEILCQWDDDDYSHPERLIVQAGHMLRQSAAACFLTDHLHFIQEHRILC